MNPLLINDEILYKKLKIFRCEKYEKFYSNHPQKELSGVNFFK